MSSIAARLRALKNASYHETDPLEFPDGTKVILSTLTGAEDRDLANYIQGHLDKSIGHYSKLESLAYSIKVIIDPHGEEIDLRNVDTIETGEMVDDIPIKVKRHVFMREIINSWNDVLLDILFLSYASLLEQVEKGIKKNIQVELGDDALKMKLISLTDEIRGLMLDAEGRNLEIPAAWLDFSDTTLVSQTDGDQLLAAIKERDPETDPEEVHPLDEQLERERAENPEVYPTISEEDPERVRR